MRRSITITAVAVMAVVLLFAAACGGGDDGDDVETATDTTSEATSTTDSEDDDGDENTSTTSGDDTATTLPGEATDFGPKADDEVAVVSVEFDDVLNVRSAPGVSNDVVTTLDSTGRAVATGRNRTLSDGALWAEIRVDGDVGWANTRFLALPGDTSDVTSEVISALGETPAAETMEDLGRVVAEARASEEPKSTITIAVAPSVGDLGEVTFDVIGVGDDSIAGERLHVFGQPDESGDGFGLKSVESTIFCLRGVSDGICV